MSAVRPGKSKSLKYYPKLKNSQVFRLFFLSFFFFSLMGYGAFLAFQMKPPASLSINLPLGPGQEQEMRHMATMCQ